MKPAEEVAKILLEIKAVILRPNRPYRYSSGILSPIYTDCRLLISHPVERERVVTLLAELTADLEYDVIAGTATAGIPHAAWLAEKMGLPMIYARSKVKAHGKQMQIEGGLKEGQRVLVVEDLISTAGSALDACTVIRENGGIAKEIAAIFDYEFPVSKQNLKTAEVNLRALTTFRNVVETALVSGNLQQKDYDLVMAWSQDPQNWSYKGDLDLI